jgi:hypothetical protein
MNPTCSQRGTWACANALTLSLLSLSLSLTHALTCTRTFAAVFLQHLEGKLCKHFWLLRRVQCAHTLKSSILNETNVSGEPPKSLSTKSVKQVSHQLQQMWTFVMLGRQTETYTETRER